MNEFIIFSLLIGCSLLWAVHPIINRMIFQEINPFHFFVLTSVTLGIISLPFLPFIDIQPFKDKPTFIISWALISVIANIMFFYCIGHSKNTLSSIVCLQNLLLALFVGILGFIVFREPFHRNQFMGILLAIASIYLLTSKD